MKQLSIEEFLKQQEAAGKPYLNNEGIPLPWESPVRQANTLSYSTKLTLLPLDRTKNPSYHRFTSSTVSHAEQMRGQAREGLSFFMAKTSKNHRTQIGENASHVIRNEAVSLTEKEFRVRAIRYISLLYKVFCKWQGAAESTGSPSTSVWETMSEWKREQTIKEFFVLYLQ